MYNLRPLWPYLLRHRKILIVGFIVAAVGSGVSTLPPYILRRAVDDLDTTGVNVSRLIQFCGWIVGAAVIDGFFKLSLIHI